MATGSCWWAAKAALPGGGLQLLSEAFLQQSARLCIWTWFSMCSREPWAVPAMVARLETALPKDSCWYGFMEDHVHGRVSPHELLHGCVGFLVGSREPHCSLAMGRRIGELARDAEAELELVRVDRLCYADSRGQVVPFVVASEWVLERVRFVTQSAAGFGTGGLRRIVFGDGRITELLAVQFGTVFVSAVDDLVKQAENADEERGVVMAEPGGFVSMLRGVASFPETIYVGGQGFL